MKLYDCDICGRHIVKEAHPGDRSKPVYHASAGDHDPAPHVLRAYA
jgi:hypothetical protein